MLTSASMTLITLKSTPSGLKCKKKKNAHILRKWNDHI